jgi:hypothetical protein
MKRMTQIDRLGFDRDDWAQEVRLAEELSRRTFRRRYGWGRTQDEAKYAAVSGYRARLMLARAERRRPTIVEIFETDFPQDPNPWLEARDRLAALAARDLPSLERAVADFYNGRAPNWSDKRRLWRCQT